MGPVCTENQLGNLTPRPDHWELSAYWEGKPSETVSNLRQSLLSPAGLEDLGDLEAACNLGGSCGNLRRSWAGEDVGSRRWAPQGSRWEREEGSRNHVHKVLGLRGT